MSLWGRMRPPVSGRLLVWRLKEVNHGAWWEQWKIWGFEVIKSHLFAVHKLNSNARCDYGSRRKRLQNHSFWDGFGLETMFPNLANRFFGSSGCLSQSPGLQRRKATHLTWPSSLWMLVAWLPWSTTSLRCGTVWVLVDFWMKSFEKKKKKKKYWVLAPENRSWRTFCPPWSAFLLPVDSDQARGNNRLPGIMTLGYIAALGASASESKQQEVFGKAEADARLLSSLLGCSLLGALKGFVLCWFWTSAKRVDQLKDAQDALTRALKERFAPIKSSAFWRAHIFLKQAPGWMFVTRLLWYVECLKRPIW